jgi:NADH:ubiquinone oxidoreductase subunit
MHIGTLLYTWLKGKLVGVDEYGNRYYQGRGIRHGRNRRWVLYKGSAEASKVPPEWHAWLHHTTDQPLSETAAQVQPWQKEHLPNLTGTRGAYRPRGHDAAGGRRAPATGDYQAWKPQ